MMNEKDLLRNTFGAKLVTRIKEDVSYWLEEDLIVWVVFIGTSKLTTGSGWHVFHGPVEPCSEATTSGYAGSGL